MTVSLRPGLGTLKLPDEPDDKFFILPNHHSVRHTYDTAASVIQSARYKPLK